MANVNVPYANPGQAAFEQLDTWTNEFFLSGPEPLGTMTFKAANGQVLPFLTVVGFNSSGLVVKAVWSADPAVNITPIGVINTPVVGDSTNAVPAIIWYKGGFDPDKLVWDASFNTDLKKRQAFAASTGPTAIVLRKRAPLSV